LSTPPVFSSFCRMKFASIISLLATGVAAQQENLPNIVELAQSLSDLSTLVAAVVAGDLADTLSSSGPFTVFAPTNEAFKQISIGAGHKPFPEDTLDKLLKAENKEVLVNLLKNHVVEGEIKVKEFNKHDAGNYVKTLSGGQLRLNDGTNYGGQYPKARACPIVSGSGVICTYLARLSAKEQLGDNVASNGVVHILDGVLVPDYDGPQLPNKLAPGNIVELAQSVDNLSTLVTAVVAADLVQTLSSAGLFTVFAPNNEGFGKLPSGTLDSLLKPENKAQLVDILTYHVLPRQVASIELGQTQGTDFLVTGTVEEKPIRYQNNKAGVKVGANSDDLKIVLSVDNFATNGVVHIIDGVMLPATVATMNAVRLTSFTGSDCRGDQKGSFDVLDGKCYQLSVVPESTQTEDQRIVCKPNGDAYVLKYNSRDGSCSREIVSIADARFVAKKGQCFGPVFGTGIKIDCSPPARNNIVELAETVSDLSTLVSAVIAGDLVDTLSSTGPFTVFAPTNEGFAALPPGTLDSLMKPMNKGQLVDILTYHVLEGQVLSTDLDLFQEVKTVEGNKLKIQKFGGKVQVGASVSPTDLKQVTSADNLASNGVVHIINGVLLPPANIV